MVLKNAVNVSGQGMQPWMALLAMGFEMSETSWILATNV